MEEMLTKASQMEGSAFLLLSLTPSHTLPASPLPSSAPPRWVRGCADRSKRPMPGGGGGGGCVCLSLYDRRGESREVQVSAPPTLPKQKHLNRMASFLRWVLRAGEYNF